MRMSCNGCRVLRKGCKENCSIRPCLAWIKTAEAQANATVFLAKFYGRTGLINLINSGPEHLRPAIFRSLLQEACGRIVNPIYGSVGLSWSGNWQLCEAAVEAVLRGEPITSMASEAAADGHGPPLKAYDFRHVYRDESSAGTEKPCNPRRRAAAKKPTKCEGVASSGDELNRSSSHESSLSHQSDVAVPDGESKDMESTVSAEEETAARLRLLFPAEPISSFSKPDAAAARDCVDIELELELKLGLEPEPEPEPRTYQVVPVKKRRLGTFGTCERESKCMEELGL